MARLYRWLAVLSLLAYLACFVIGTGYVVATQSRLPPYDTTPLSQAQQFLARGDVARAAQQYRMLARIDPASYETPRQLADLLKSVGDSSGQIDVGKAGLDRFPRNPAAHRNLGWAYFNNKRFDEARASFERALALDPRDVEAQHAIGEVWLDQDRFEEAIQAFALALRIDPTYARAHNSMGIAYALSRRYPEALRHFEEAVRLDPQPQYQQNLQRARAQAAGGRP